VTHTRTFNDRLEVLDTRPTPAAYQALAREIGELRAGLRPLKVALLSSFTIDPLVPFLRVEAARDGFDADVYVSPFNSVNQSLLDPDGACVRHRPDIVFITQLLSDICPPLSDDFLALEPDTVDRLIEDTVEGCVAAVETFVARTHATVVMSNVSLPPAPLLGVYEDMADGSQTAAIRRMNARLVERVRSTAGVYVQDVDGLSAQVGRRRWHDARMWSLARAPLSAAALPVLASSHAAFMRAAFGPPRKCLVLDLDGTLWGGTLGEEGLSGIKIGHTYPGNAFRRFQQTVLSLHRRGILLAIVSKNNDGEVAEVFRSHPDMILKAEHFSATRINWRDKVDNLLDIAAELRIGTDSLVFFDDSPVECALVRQLLPDVLTIQAPQDVLDYSEALERSRAFERLAFTAEDRRRGQMYREQTERARLLPAAGSLDAFLESLQMEAEIRPVDDFTLPRAVELTQKTNQFNLTTRRYSAPELAAAIEEADRAAFSLRLTDRFGDNGIVGLAVLRIETDALVIEAFLLSCRVIGRGAETALLSFLAAWARERGLRALDGEFIPTPKNAPAADCYSRHGFVPVGTTTSGTKWRLSTIDADVPWPPTIRAAHSLV
jgi:FkbH-like protein